MKFRTASCALAAALLAAPIAAGEDAKPSIVLASTTSTEQSGLFARLLPAFTRASGIEVRVVAVGTGQALDLARRGDADVVLVHDLAAEQKFVAEGFGVKRYPVMYNDFVLIGPKTDPAGARGLGILPALAKIEAAKAPFVSRGDKSGTHAAERRLWTEAGFPAPSGDGYRETGSGMGPTLNVASGMNAYTLSDRGTWLSFRNRGELVVLVQGDERLFNAYGVVLVNPARHPHVKAAAGQAFIDWLISPEGQAAIGAYTIEGEPLFVPNYRGE